MQTRLGSRDLVDAGAIHVFCGGPVVGLTEVDDQVWAQDSPDVLEDAETGDRLAAFAQQ